MNSSKMNIKRIKFSDGIIILFALATLIYVIFSLTKIVTTTAPDFPSFYAATVDLLHHKNPYSDKHIPIVYNYPSVTTLFILPFILSSLDFMILRF